MCWLLYCESIEFQFQYDAGVDFIIQKQNINKMQN